MTKDISRLKLIGKNIEDLKTISAYCQDSIVKIKDLVYLKENKIFIIMLSRFMWEDIEKGVFRNYKRIKSVLKFNFIENVLAKNIDQQQKNRNLELLAIKSNYNQNNLYDINLIFSGNGIILLKSEEMDVMLDDQEYFWGVKHSPKHKIQNVKIIELKKYKFFKKKVLKHLNRQL